tara:strand:- start:220 stop:435 length:216 start_codon:yes stop_codon:yes gene_type:complete
MKSLFLNIKNIIPYLLLIAIYFFFINIEARNSQNIYKNNKVIGNDKRSKELKMDIKDTITRIEIPVIEYNQ